MIAGCLALALALAAGGQAGQTTPSPFELVRAQARLSGIYERIDAGAFADAARQAEAAEAAAPSAALRSEAAFLLATARLRLGDAPGALQAAARADGHDPIGVLTLLGDAALRSGDVYGAADRFAEAFERAEAQGRAEAPGLLASLASARLAGGDPQTALRLSEAALQRMPEGEAVQRLFAAEVRAVALDRLGAPLDAAQAFDAIALTRASLQGADHPATLFAAFNAASALFEGRRFQNALERREALLLRTVAALGEDHPLTALALENAAESRSEAGLAAAAGDAHARAVAIYASAPGAGGAAGARARSAYGLHLLETGAPRPALGQLRLAFQAAPDGFADAGEIDRREAARRLVEAAYAVASQR
ncbi:MAG: hypothetical protein NXI12_06725 [Alphaproteobacteria bacterium]|nr:hypothetical protein [Alphaproteobacteria bacterium]